ncbi:myosin light chain kinase 3 isoform X3 [Leucoraja erinacea]|uniref:myosin light chain kinase 3 isoform X3 n=1 Tax=Leucoraja erinaceus TaxID=7782 RepID=UPI002455CBFF|nr:myosin light chain kinase 3 isoform X3 [Leucoraja erinacea]XP_055507727.1 myosin light chain kinase 3 isoform X3 [Leucoraja erinacea]
MNTPPRKNSSTLVHSLAKVFDSNAIQSQGPPRITGSSRKCSKSSRNNSLESFNAMDIKLESLNQTVDKILGVQENVVQKLDGLTQDVGRIRKDIEMLKTSKEIMKQDTICQGEENKSTKVSGEISNMLSTLNQHSKEQTKKIDGIENVLLGVQQVINYLGETFKNSRIAEYICKGQVTSKQQGVMSSSEQKIFKKKITSGKVLLRRKKIKVKDQRANEVKGKQNLNDKEIKSSQKKKSPETKGQIQKSLHTFADTKVQNLNNENANSSRVFEAQHEVKDLTEQNNVTKLKGSTSVEDVGLFEPEPCRVAEDSASAFNPEFSDATSDTYAGGEKKDEDATAEEQRELKPAGVNQSNTARQNDERTERNNVMHENIQHIGAQAKMQAEKDDNEYKELITESVPTKRNVYLIAKENQERVKEHLEVEERNDTERDTGFECTDSDLTITEESKGKTMGSHVEETSKEQLTNRCGESEGDINALLVAAAEPEEETSQNIEQQEAKDLSNSSKRGTEEDLIKDDSKKSRVEENGCSQERSSVPASGQMTATSADGQHEINQAVDETEVERGHTVIDDGPAPPAPFEHRIVSTNVAKVSNYYTIKQSEILGGGRFGQVHKCVEKSTGLTLAAKIIKTRAAKQKEEVKNEIHVMNHLNHTNLIQLYDAFETKNDIILIMEYIEGGELFDRIIDENYNLTEMDTILFVKQICEGLQYMHQMYILHLDLKPENILCVNREANQVKIIDFGLARRYKPREKLKINFGTPEFLAPEVVNYDFVSFPTDMWSLGVIAYMLLSGLSPFLGDDDNETLNNILACKWDLDDAEFENVSEDAKEFISKLLIKEKGWRISANEALKHPWLSDQNLHYKLGYKCKNKCCPVSQTTLAN